MTDTQSPPPSVNAHDPLPEGNWLWRRVFVFALCSAIAFGTWVTVQAMINLSPNHSDLTIQALVKIVGWLLLFGWFAMTYYMVGTNAEQVVKIVQTASLFKQGIGSTITQIAEGPDGSRATATTTTGPVVVPPATVSTAGGASDKTGLPDIPPKALIIPEDAPWHKP